MTLPHQASLFTHLTLALSGTALAVAELDFLPEIPYLLVVYLSLLLLSWQTSGRWVLPTWGANLLGLAIAGGASTWIAMRLNDPEVSNLLRDVPIAVAIVPYFGPILLLLLLVRLYQPRAAHDFAVLQGLGLLQAALGCVLGSGTLFGGLLLAYIVMGMCALATQERLRQRALSAPVPSTPTPFRMPWLLFCLRWTVGVSLIGVPLFLLTPRTDGPEWDPWGRFGTQQSRQVRIRTGFSDEIDLNRGSTLEPDSRIAFSFTVTDCFGNPERGLPNDQRFRGVVLDRYEDGIWRSGLNWTSRLPLYRPPETLDNSPGTLLLDFRVPGRTGGLFLAEPAMPGPELGVVPIWVPTMLERRRQAPLFYEVEGTIIPQGYLARSEYRYTQIFSRRQARDRYPARRTRDTYLQRLLRVRPAELEAWTRDLLLQLTQARQGQYQTLRDALQANATTGDSVPPVYWETIGKLLCSYLADSGQFLYSLDNQRDQPALDPVMDFLQNVRRGSCERFASALALMLRSQGIPSRIIKGYRGAEEIGEGQYQVRESSAHAWVEMLALSPGSKELRFDWLLLDPTPGNEESPPLTSGLSRLWQLQQSGQALWQDLVIGYNAAHQAGLWEDLFSLPRWSNLAPWVVAGFSLLLAIGLVRRRRRRRRQQQGRAGAAALYADLVTLLQRRGKLAPLPGETPRELGARAADFLGQRPACQPLADLPPRIVLLYYEAKYGGQAPTPDELTAAWRQLATLEAALRR
ncbi:MAG: transglutaminaseTgpA domain-containing protein [Gemmataceae bacterium]